MKTINTWMILYLLLFTSCGEQVINPEKLNVIPPVFPDYTGVTVPASIAPLNFVLSIPYDKIDVTISGKKGSLHIQSDKVAAFPPSDWSSIVQDNIGDSLQITVSVKSEGKWRQYLPFAIYISPDSIDYGLVYRLIAPGYEVWSKMGIYETCLSTAKQSTILDNKLMAPNCMNCHTFPQNNPHKMSLHIRGANGATALVQNGSIEMLATKTDKMIGNAQYTYWHPSEKYIAFSTNKTQQGFHARDEKRVEVIDLESDVFVYDIVNNEMVSCPQLSSKESFETFPSFSADGKTLFFCTAAARPIPEEYNQIRYNLCSVSFDPVSRTFGNKVDTLVAAEAMGKSVSFPRPSYDGKYLMFTMSDYGNFSIWHKEADLWLVDLNTGISRSLTEVNSNDVESYHNWSSNSRWFVFSSRRIDGLYTRPFIANIDSNGKIGKPFLLPQKDPEEYIRSFYSYNLPEFVTGPVEVNPRDLAAAAMKPERKQVKPAN
ncbi:MAG TPA: hypothetical protein PKJ87_04775 [Macellibacteroides fermentans]|nr:hypothetical protein [Macellibacteroides fermentans]